jgi:hypothetical protein
VKDMAYQFVKFENTGGKYETRISITASRSIGFPTKFYKDNNINRYKYVILFYDEEKKAVGIKFTRDEDEPHKYTIIKGEKYGGSVVATSFFKKYNIDATKFKGKYKWRKVRTDFGILFVIEIQEGQKRPAPEKTSSA